MYNIVIMQMFGATCVLFHVPIMGQYTSCSKDMNNYNTLSLSLPPPLSLSLHIYIYIYIYKHPFHTEYLIKFTYLQHRLEDNKPF
jgi:hypothetical protein